MVKAKSKTRKSKKKGGYKIKTLKNKSKRKKHGILPALLNFALIIPEESVNIAYGIYGKFMKPFNRAVSKKLKGRTSPAQVSKALRQTIKKPKFKKAWGKTVTDIFDVLLRPVLAKTGALMKAEGSMVAGAVAKTAGKISLRSAQAVAESLEAALTAIPGVGTVIDTLTVVQAVIDSFATLTIQSLKIMTKMLTSFMVISGETMGPLAKVFGSIKNLAGTISFPRRSKTRKNRSKKSLTTLGVES